MKTRKHLFLLGLLLLLFGVIVAGCGTKAELTAQTSTAAHAQTGAMNQENASDRPTITVKINNFKFEPEFTTVPPGTRVIFVNEDPTPHNVVQGSAGEVGKKDHKPSFMSPDLDQGDTWEIVFDDVGEYTFSCTIAGHYLLGMEGTIRVEEGAEIVASEADSTSGAIDKSLVSPRNDPDALPVSLNVSDLPDGLIATPEGLAVLEPFHIDGDVKEFAIDIQEVTHELVDGVSVTAWAFNGTVPGPVLRVTEGDLVRVHFTNTHHQPHTIHWHGIYADQKYDGVPHTSRAVMPGETYVYEFVAENAGTYMYHCHVDSYRHIDMGMYGGLIIEPKGPATWDREYTLVLDDWDSEIEPLATRYEPDHNYFIINGKSFPELPTLPIKVGETTRVRLINAGYNNFSMHLHGPHFEVMATDGYELPVPYMKDTIDVAPGERYDIEIRPTKAGMYPFHAHNIQFVRNDGFYPGGIHLMFDILEEDADI